MSCTNLDTVYVSLKHIMFGLDAGDSKGKLSSNAYSHFIASRVLHTAILTSVSRN